MISKVKPVVNESGEHSEWFETWFNSPYYHILYKNRNQEEAENFLDVLVNYLKPAKDARILDVACGKGRHSIYLNKKGFDVTGFDLSAESILYDKQFENLTLNFYLHDMREVFRVNYFDIVLNLFSSFGYFEKERDNIRCLIADAICLKPDGVFVFDYFNLCKITFDKIHADEKLIDNILFKIKKFREERFIRKEITFSDQGKDYYFEEKLLLLTMNNLEEYFEKAGLKIMEVFGSYALDKFDEMKSDRLIIISKKK